MKYTRSPTGRPGARQPDLQSQNAILRQKLDTLMAEARRNEQKLRRFEALELQLVGAHSFVELIKLLLNPEAGGFQWDVTTLMLLDPDYEIRRLLADEGVEIADNPGLLFFSSLAELNSVYPHSLFPLLGPFRPGKHGLLFPSAKERLRSVAVLPLLRYGKMIGCLNIGSLEEDRFTRGVRTDFFEHFAAIVAICLENAVNMHRLKQQGITDPLTGVNNRRFFDQRLTEEMEVARRNRESLSCMLLDVDHFKKVNDTYGHGTGDEVLKQVASIIRGQLRGGDVLARYGGEEFVVLLQKTQRETAEEVAERVRRAVSLHEYATPTGATFSVTVSIGLATYDSRLASGTTKPTGEELVNFADTCLYSAKNGGRNQVVADGPLSLEKAA